jgi:hypothetical protein
MSCGMYRAVAAPKSPISGVMLASTLTSTQTASVL